MQGIYKITNLINNHAYIGQSKNIEFRLKTHFKKAFILDSEEFDKVLYQAIRKYGAENFGTEILEELPEASRQLLNIRESYWIDKYDTYHNGYNETLGGDGVSGAIGEKHHNHKLTEADVIAIRQRWAACKESVQDIYTTYKDSITKAGFKKIYTWQTWTHLLPELNTTEAKQWHKEKANELFSHKGETNPRSKLSDTQVIEARDRYAKGEASKVIYEDYKHTGITLGSFRNILVNFNRQYLIDNGDKR
jgi:group I intron endonuclease